MNDEIKQDRSPKGAVTVPLTDAIDLLRKLYSEIRRASVNVETAARALGYSGISGAALDRLAALTQYKLIDRKQGKVSISALAIRMLHPTSAEQSEKSLQEAVLAPPVFNELFRDYRGTSEEVIMSHLVQKGFTQERAKGVARTFLSNATYFPQEMTGILSVGDEGEVEGNLAKALPLPATAVSAGAKAEALANVVRRHVDASVPSGDVLARYSIPLGENEATLVFTGKSLSPEDFDALIEYVELFKKQFERRQPKSTRQSATETEQNRSETPVKGEELF